MTYQSCSDQFPETAFQTEPSGLAKPSAVARILFMVTTGAVCLTAMVGGMTAGLLYASGIFQ